MFPVRLVVGSAIAAALLVARPASAGTSLGIDADYLSTQGAGSLRFDLALERSLVPVLSLGARFGFLVGTTGVGPAIPIDARLRLRARPVYLDGLLGPWVFLRGQNAVRLHSAIGFGVVQGPLELGIEAGWIDPGGMVGVRIAFPI